MKKILLLALAGLPLLGYSQTFKVLDTDITGDDHSFAADVTELAYTLSSNSDSLFVRITHNKPRGGDFGFALALDTNLNPNDGQTINQTNIFGSPNTSMKSDLLFYAYQNNFFPGVFTESYGPTGGPLSISYELDTADAFFSIFKIALADLGGNIDFNLIGFVGGFDISASGPSDAVPNSTFSQIRESSVGIQEFALETKLYPNPATDFFSLDYNGTIKIFNAQGMLVKQVDVTAGEIVDCSDLSPSVYTILHENGKSAGKLILH